MRLNFIKTVNLIINRCVLIALIQLQLFLLFLLLLVFLFLFTFFFLLLFVFNLLAAPRIVAFLYNDRIHIDLIYCSLNQLSIDLWTKQVLLDSTHTDHELHQLPHEIGQPSHRTSQHVQCVHSSKGISNVKSEAVGKQQSEACQNQEGRDQNG